MSSAGVDPIDDISRPAATARAGHSRFFRHGLGTLALVIAVVTLFPALASAHAQLLSTFPQSDALMAREPDQVSFTFGESVGIEGQAVRVYDHTGAEVDTGPTFHPHGDGPTVAVALKPNLPDGTYTATYRVVSADTHVVTGGVVFSIGEPSPSGGGANLNQLVASQTSGAATHTAFSVVHSLEYGAIGLGAGLLIFLSVIWPGAAPPSVRRRARLTLTVAAVAGLLAAAAGVALEAAEAQGVSFWSALNSRDISPVLHVRFGEVWGAGAIAWAVALVLLILPLAPGRRASRWASAALAVPLLALIALPALAGHASEQSPVGLFIPANLLHVSAMSLWLGGLVGLLIAAMPGGGAETATLNVALARFSPLALACVIALIVTGVIQAVIELSAWSQLWDTAYGRGILVKSAGLAVLIGLGALQRRRTIPLLREASGPGGDSAHATDAGRSLARRALGAELASFVVVLAGAGSLAQSAPGQEAMDMAAGRYSQQAMGAMPGMAMNSSAGGPATLSTHLGQVALRVVVTPAQTGANTITATLTRANGRPFAGTRQLTITASLAKQQIGPLTLKVHRTGPGRFVTSGAVLGVPGTWTLTFINRTSEFDETQKSIQVGIE